MAIDPKRLEQEIAAIHKRILSNQCVISALCEVVKDELGEAALERALSKALTIADHIDAPFSYKPSKSHISLIMGQDLA
nr:hypothetical protein [uncultured Pseudomonas sp.]